MDAEARTLQGEQINGEEQAHEQRYRNKGRQF